MFSGALYGRKPPRKTTRGPCSAPFGPRDLGISFFLVSMRGVFVIRQTLEP